MRYGSRTYGTKKYRTSLHGWLLALVSLFAAGPANLAGADDSWAVAPAAEEVLRTPEKERASKLTALAAGPFDPWLLVEHLRARGVPTPLLAAYAVRVEARAPALEAYLSGRGRVVPTLKELAALEAARVCLDEEEPEKCLAALMAGTSSSQPGTVLAAARTFLQARAYEQSGLRAKCTTMALRAGEAARALGWVALAEEAYDLGIGEALVAGMLDEARECAFGLLAIQEAREDTEAIAYTHQDIGGINYRRGDHSGALRHLDEALALHEALGATSDAADVRSLSSVVLSQVGLLHRARESVRQLAANESVFSGPETLADFRSNAAVVYTRLGDPRRALDLLEGEVRASRARHDRSAEAISLGNLGHVHRMENYWEDAVACYQRAVDLFLEDGDAFNIAIGRLSIAGAYAHHAREMSAADALDAALRRIRGEPTRAESDSVGAAATRACESGLAILKEARLVLDSAGAVGAAALARLTECDLLFLLGRLDGLEGRFERLCDEARRLRLRDECASAAAGLVRLHVAQGKWPAAIRCARKAIEDLAGGYGCLSDADIARARSLEADVYDLGIRAAGAAGRIDDLHYFLEGSRAAALLRGMGGRAAALRATVPEELQQQLRAAVGAKVRAMAGRSQALQQGRGQERGALNQVVAKARRAELDLRTQIQVLEQKAAEHLLPPRIEVIADLKRSLKRSGRGQVPTTYLAFNLQALDGWCLVVDGEEERFVHLKAQDVLPIHDALEAVVDGRHGEWAPDTLKKLRAHLLGPLGLPTGKAHYLISPDRELAYVPYAALLPDDVTFSLVPSATTYLLLREQRRKRGKGILGVGDPRYSTAQDENVFASRGGTPLIRLKNSADEITSATGGKHDLRLLGAEATKARFLAALQSKGPGWRWRAVHVACHGFVDVEWPSLSALALAPTPTDDGFLLADELLRLPLNSDLMILSACESGRGRYVRAEGIMGLARSCMYAGAPRVLCSLWLVDDEATGYLMKKFHEAWRGGMNTAAALRTAQVAVRDRIVEEKRPGGKTEKTARWSDPAYWAGWALWGLPE